MQALKPYCLVKVVKRKRGSRLNYFQLVSGVKTAGGLFQKWVYLYLACQTLFTLERRSNYGDKT